MSREMWDDSLIVFGQKLGHKQRVRRTEHELGSSLTHD